jgi:hypothetical protein
MPTYQWQSSADDATWSNISGATATIYAPSALTTTTYYRRTAINTCGTVYTSSVKITVYAELTAGAIGSVQSICRGATPAQLTNTTSASGGNTTPTYQWQSSTDNSMFTDISGTTSTTYAPGALTQTTYYRRVASNTCGSVNSNTVTITVYTALNGGTIAADQSICNGKTPTALSSSSAASGGTGTTTYQWQSSTDNSTFTDISGATSTTYAPGALTQTTYYRRVATNICSVNSNTVTITVYATLTAGAIDSAQSICRGATPVQLTNTTSASGGNTTPTYQWQSSADNSTWSDISSATSATYAPGALMATTYYRRAASNTCGTEYTTSVEITVYDELSGGTVSSAQTICNDKTPQSLTGTAPSGGAGGYAYQWEQSADGLTGWTNVAGGSGATSDSYSPPALTQTTWYRRKVIDSQCKDDYTYSSNTVKITVRHLSLYNYPDLRVRVCPDAGTSINLSKYVDTLDLASGYPQWTSLSGIPIGKFDGVISANNLGSRGTYTFTYTVSNPCTTDDITRKVYVEVLNGVRMPRPRDTIVICSDNAEAVNINQIFGIDAGYYDGAWSYYSQNPGNGDVDNYVTESHSSMYYGAVVMNGKGIYNDSSIDYISGTNNKKIVFTYTSKTGSCLGGKPYTIVIILTRS